MKPINCVVCWLHVGSPANPMIVQVQNAYQKFYVRSMWGISSKARPAWFVGVFRWSENATRLSKKPLWGTPAESAPSMGVRPRDIELQRRALSNGTTTDRERGRAAWFRREGRLEPQDQDGLPTCEEWLRGWDEMETVLKEFPPNTSCYANREGDCYWARCPQNRDDESGRTGRSCPLDRNSHSEYR